MVYDTQRTMDVINGVHKPTLNWGAAGGRHCGDLVPIAIP